MDGVGRLAVRVNSSVVVSVCHSTLKGLHGHTEKMEAYIHMHSQTIIITIIIYHAYCMFQSLKLKLPGLGYVGVPHWSKMIDVV